MFENAKFDPAIREVIEQNPCRQLPAPQTPLFSKPTGPSRYMAHGKAPKRMGRAAKAKLITAGGVQARACAADPPADEDAPPCKFFQSLRVHGFS